MRQESKLDASRMSEFARWMLLRIKQRGTSITTLAEQAGVDKSYLYKVLKSYLPQYRQYKRPGFDRTVRIGQVLGDVPGAVRAAGYGETYGASPPTADVEERQRGVDRGTPGRIPVATGAASDGLPERTEDWPPELLEAMHYSRTLSPEVQRYIYHLWREQARMEAALMQKRQETEAELKRLGWKEEMKETSVTPPKTDG